MTKGENPLQHFLAMHLTAKSFQALTSHSSIDQRHSGLMVFVPWAVSRWLDNSYIGVCSFSRNAYCFKYLIVSLDGNAEVMDLTTTEPGDMVDLNNLPGDMVDLNNLR